MFLTSLAHRRADRHRRADQLLRSHQPLGRRPTARAVLSPDSGRAGAALQCLLLELRPAADSGSVWYWIASGVTRVGRWSAFLWGAAQLLTACAGGFAGIFAARLLLGIAEAPSFPANSKATGYWFPRAERALSTALYRLRGQILERHRRAARCAGGGAAWGGAGASAVVAALSFIYFVVFCRVYRDPSQHPGLTREERAVPRRRRRGARRTARRDHRRHARLPAEHAQGLGTRDRIRSLWLQLQPLSDLAARLPRAHDAPQTFSPLGGLRGHPLGLRFRRRPAGGRLADRLPDRQGTRRDACPQGGTGDRHVCRHRGARRDGHDPSWRRVGVDLHRPGRTLGRRARSPGR